MKKLNLITFALILSLLSCSSKPEKVDRTEFYKELIEMLVVEEKEYSENFKRFQLNEAHLELVAAGKDAWPILFKHLDDKRPSEAARQVTGPHDVGHQCYYILHSQVVKLPKGFYTSRGIQVFNDFKPNIRDWLTQRQDKSLNEIRLETCKENLKIQKTSKYFLKSKDNRIKLLEKEINRLETIIIKEKKEGITKEIKSRLIQEQLKRVRPRVTFEDRDFYFALDYVSRFPPYDNHRDKIKYIFLFDMSEIPKIKLNINKKNITTGEILSIACEAAGISWEIGHGTIILRPINKEKHRELNLFQTSFI